MPGNRPRKHHFLPRMYLNGFCREDGTFFVYERGKKPRRSSPTNEAARRDLYAYESEQGLSFEYEERLSAHETAVAAVLKDIHDREQSLQRRYLTDYEAQVLREFVALVFTRNPASFRLAADHTGPIADMLTHQLATDPAEFAAEFRNYFGRFGLSGEPLQREMEIARKAILDGVFNKPEPAWMPLYSMFELARMMVEELVLYEYLIVVANRHQHFITGDMPVVSGKDEAGKLRLGSGLADPDTQVWFPLSSRLCLLWKRNLEPGYGRLPSRGVRLANANVMRFAHRYVYADFYSEDLARQFTASESDKLVLGVNAIVPQVK